jgi:hypothetical protein
VKAPFRGALSYRHLSLRILAGAGVFPDKFPPVRLFLISEYTLYPFPFCTRIDRRLAEQCQDSHSPLKIN